MTETLAIDLQPTLTSRLAEVDFSDLKFGKIFADHMFVADYRDGRWQDMRICAYGDMALSPATSALHYGQTCFEGMKAYRLQTSGELVIFRPQANFERLNASADRLCMPALPEEVFFGGLTQLIHQDAAWVPRQAGSSLYIRPFLFATDEFIGVRASQTYRFVIFTCPVGIYYTAPVRVRVETHYTRAAAGGTGYAKAGGNYGGALYPTAQAIADGFQQLIWTDALEHKYIEESGTMNVMFIVDGTVLTPALSDTILKGVTRDSILTLARDMGMPVEERRIEVAEIVRALEAGTLSDAFGVGTAATFATMELIEIEGVPYDLPAPSTHALALRQAIEDIRTGVAEDTHGWLYKL